MDKLPPGYDSWLTTDPSLEEPVDESLYGWLEAIRDELDATNRVMKRQGLDAWGDIVRNKAAEIDEILTEYEDVLKEN